MNPYRLLAVAGATFFTAVGVLIGSMRSAPAQTLAPATPSSSTVVPAAAAAEKPLDTSLPTPPKAYNAPQAKTAIKKQASNDIHHVRTPSDDELPSWVPKSGRLTVVDSADLAENLGLVPQGSTKKSAERISVAEKLEEQSTARGDQVVRGVTWGFSKPHIVSRIYRR